MRSAIYTGTLVHARRSPARHVFRYPVSYWLFDLDELSQLERRLRLFSVNRPNVVGISNRLRASFSAWGGDLWALQDWYREA